VGRTSQGRRLFRVFRVFRRPSSVSSASGASSASRASGAIGCRWDVGSIGYRVFCHVYYLFCRRKPCGSAATKTIARSYCSSAQPPIRFGNLLSCYCLIVSHFRKSALTTRLPPSALSVHMAQPRSHGSQPPFCFWNLLPHGLFWWLCLFVSTTTHYFWEYTPTHYGQSHIR